MPRYLQAKQICDLLYAAPDQGDEEFAAGLGVPLERAMAVRSQWVAKIHGRCEQCSAESCDCAPSRKGDNREGAKVLTRALNAGEIYQHTVLDTIECRCCRKDSPYTVRNALWRMSKASDWDEFYKCRPCWKNRKQERADKKARKKLKPKQDVKPAAEEVTKKKVAAKKKVSKKSAKKKVAEKKTKIQSLAEPEGLTHQPFAGLKLVAQ